MDRVTDWAQLPLILRVPDLARLLGIGRTAIYERMERNPGSLPTPSSTAPFEWSRAVVQRWYETPAVLRPVRRKGRAA